MFELDASIGGDSYFTLCKKPSVDACKAVARNMWADNDRCGVLFRIYDADFERLILVNRETGSWRMRWVDGNCLSREQQADSAALRSRSAQEGEGC